MKTFLLAVAILLTLNMSAIAEGKYYISNIAGSGTEADPAWIIASAIATQEQCETIWGAASLIPPIFPWALVYVDGCADYTAFLGLSEVNKIPSFGVHVKLSAMSAMAKDDISNIFISRSIPSSCFDNSVCFAEMLNCVCHLVPGFSSCDVTLWGDY